MSRIGSIFLIFGLFLGVFPVIGAEIGFLVKFTGLFKLSVLEFGLIISALGAVFIFVDLSITYLKFHPLGRYFSARKKAKEAESSDIDSKPVSLQDKSGNGN